MFFMGVCVCVIISSYGCGLLCFYGLSMLSTSMGLSYYGIELLCLFMVMNYGCELLSKGPRGLQCVKGRQEISIGPIGLHQKAQADP